MSLNHLYHRNKNANIASSALFMCIMAVSLVVLPSCSSAPKAEAESQAGGRNGQNAQNATAVDVANARTGSLKEELAYTGTTVPNQQVALRSRAEGKLLQLNANVGDRVRRGQILAQIDDTSLVTAETQAQAQLAALESEVASARNQVSNANAQAQQARIELQQAQSDAARFQQLLRDGAISKQQAELAQTKAQTAAQIVRAALEQVNTEQQQVAAAQGRVRAQRAALTQARERLSYLSLTSPINGIVVAKFTEPGNLLQPGTEVLRIGDFSRIKVILNLSELELSKVRLGQSVRVKLDAFPNQEFTGQVTNISPSADTTARLVPIEVSIPNNGRIGSGLLARVTFSGTTTENIVIPQTALQVSRRQGQQGQKQQGNNSAQQQGTVFVVNTQGQEAKVEARQVTLGDRANGQVEILSGLQPGERFVARSGRPLKNGDSVRLSVLSEK